MEGDRGGGGAGTREQWRREVYGRRKKRGWETGYPRGWEPGEIGNELHNIAESFTIEKAHKGGND